MLYLGGCAAAPPPVETDPAALALERVNADERWSRDRRAQLDTLFTRAVGAEQSRNALEWLRVYVLAQVADRQDRDARSGEVDALAVRLDHVAQVREKGAAGFGSELAQLRGEVEQLRLLYSRPLAEPGAVAGGPEPPRRE